MKVLVTGGAGFIGSHLVHLLMEKDWHVAVLDALTYAGDRASLARWDGSPRFRLQVGDVADPAAVDAAMEGADTVFHLAAESHVDRSILDGAPFMRTNVVGTQVVLDAARRHGVRRFVHVSTDEVYGDVATGSSVEGDPLRPSSPYAASKAGADLTASAHFRTYGTPVVITRGSNTFGPRQYPEKLVPFFLSRALAGEELPLYGDGLQARDWLHVEDHCSAIVLVGERGEPGGVYNVSAGNEHTNLQVARRLLALAGRPESLLRHVQDRPGHDRRYSVDSARLRALGWTPRWDFAAGLESTVEWYREHSEWWGAVRERQADYREFMRRQYPARLGSES